MPSIMIAGGQAKSSDPQRAIGAQVGDLSGV
jgi:hypothetical protein